MTSLVDLVTIVHEHFDRADIDHAFGGALALAYIAEPRGTVDIDVNAFVPVGELDRVAEALRPAGFTLDDDSGEPPVSGHRFAHEIEPFPVDVFCNLDDRYAHAAARVERHPFGVDGDLLPFLSAEDLTVFKLSFGRPQDWVDVEMIALARPDLDVAYIEDQLIALRGPTMHPRLARFQSFFRSR